MNIHWIAVFVATVFEVLWVIGLKYSSSVLDWVSTILCIGLTFALLTFANKKIPISTTYTIFTGLGTVGTLFVDILFFGEELKAVKLLFILMLIIGVIGLQIVTNKDEATIKEVNK